MILDDKVVSGNFEFHRSSIDGVMVVDVRRFDDDRGYFMETYRKIDFAAGGITCDFVQDNQSASVRGVLRGLHFQIANQQAKLVRVTVGEVFDVAVDLRAGSPTFGQWEGVVLSAENHRQFFIPRGFAHGFLVLSERAEFCYKCDNFYCPGDEGGLIWSDPTVGIAWPALSGDSAFNPEALILSEKDKLFPTLPEICAL